MSRRRSNRRLDRQRKRHERQHLDHDLPTVRRKLVEFKVPPRLVFGSILVGLAMFALIDTTVGFPGRLRMQGYVAAFGTEYQARTISLPERKSRFPFCGRRTCDSHDLAYYPVRVRWCSSPNSCHEDRVELEGYYGYVIEVESCSLASKDLECSRVPMDEVMPVGTRIPIRVLGGVAMVPFLTVTDKHWSKSSLSRLKASDIAADPGARWLEFWLSTFVYLALTGVSVVPIVAGLYPMHLFQPMKRRS